MRTYTPEACEYCRAESVRGGGGLPVQELPWKSEVRYRRCPKCDVLWVDRNGKPSVMDVPEGPSDRIELSS
jgi:hypothetical protein